MALLDHREGKMKVRNIMVDWMEGYLNDPDIKVIVDRIPEIEEMVFERRGTLYFAHEDGYVNFYSYNHPGDGYGGRKFTLNMKDGTQSILKGPWSSNSASMNNAGFPPSAEVSITDKEQTWVEGHTFYAGAMTVEKLNMAFKKFLPSVELRPVTEDGMPKWEVRKDNLNKKELLEMSYLSDPYRASRDEFEKKVEIGSGEGCVRRPIKKEL